MDRLEGLKGNLLANSQGINPSMRREPQGVLKRDWEQRKKNTWITTWRKRKVEGEWLEKSER